MSVRVLEPPPMAMDARSALRSAASSCGLSEFEAADEQLFFATNRDEAEFLFENIFGRSACVRQRYAHSRY